MPKKIAPSQGLSYGWVRGEDFWGGPVNDNFIFLDTTLHPIVESMSFSAPPATAKEGQAYLIAENATGVWAGHEKQLAVLVEGVWIFYAPKDGWRIRLRSLNGFYWYNEDHWESETTGEDPDDPGGDPTAKPVGWDIGVTVSDAMYADEPLVHLPILDPSLLPANMAESALDMMAAAEAYVQLRVQRNGSNVGTITVQTGQYNATFATSGGQAVTFAKGDRLTIRGPAVAVDSFKNFGFVIRMKLT